MSKELKGLKVDELLAKLKANKEAVLTFENAKLTESPYYKSAVEEGLSIEEELASRKGEMLASALSDAISATVNKELKGKEGEIEKDVTLTVIISKNAETAEITVKTTAGKPRKPSEGGVSSSGGTRGERKGAKVVCLNGAVIEGTSAAEVLQKLKDNGTILPTIGEGDSAVRVLDSLVTKKQIASFERVELQKAEAKTEDSAVESNSIATESKSTLPEKNSDNADKKAGSHKAK